jgi:hypothetical protein
MMIRSRSNSRLDLIVGFDINSNKPSGSVATVLLTSLKNITQ